MNLVILFFVFVFGTVVGSFLNVVIYRFQTGAKIANDRSKCLSCARKLAPHMLIPVFSYLFQKGRCAYCQVRISVQYPLVELGAGIFMLTAFMVSGFNPLMPVLTDGMMFIIDAAILMVLLLIGVYDLRHKIIPDTFALTLGVLTLMRIGFLGYADGGHWLSALLTGIGVALPLAGLWLFSGGRWMGLGDAKLAISLGWFLGYPFGISAIVLAFWIGTIPALFLLFWNRKRTTMESEIPFAPFLVLATLALYVYPIDIFQLTTIYP
jgi:leader peptidase (prepilin peptidase) / N-methyltransferase